MKKLVVVAGLSGAGKSYLLDQLIFRSLNLIPIKKLSTRKLRPYESDQDIDLEYSVSRQKISKCEYKYNYAGETYGVRKKDINAVLSEGNSPVVIIRNSQIVATLKEDYPTALSIFVKSAYTGQDLEEMLKKQGRTDIDIEERMDRQLTDLIDYTKNFFLYDHVFSNLYDDDSLVDQFDVAIRLEEKNKPLESGLTFVLMSFNPDMDSIFSEMEDAAKLVSQNIKVARIDKKRGDFSITPEILSMIDRAELIVCDLTEEKPNVYYELGYARGKNKTVINVAKKGTKLHFDVKDNRTIFYNNSTELRRELAEEFQEFYGLQTS